MGLMAVSKTYPPKGGKGNCNKFAATIPSPALIVSLTLSKKSGVDLAIRAVDYGFS